MACICPRTVEMETDRETEKKEEVKREQCVRVQLDSGIAAFLHLETRVVSGNETIAGGPF